MPDSIKPYDITPVPRFAFSPGLTLWLLFLGFWVVLIGVLWLRRKREMRLRPTIDPLLAAEEEILKIAKRGGTLTQADNDSISAALKRALAATGLIDLSACSLRELELANQSAQPSFKPLISQIILLDKFKYSKQSAHQLAQEQIEAVIQDLRTLRNERAQA